MDAVRVDLRAYTASFRVPGMMGYQITSPVPPPATVYGLLAAAAGREVTPDETWVAYRFEYEARAQDLEKVIAFGPGGPRWDAKLNAVSSAPIIRQFLFNPRLVLYVKPGAVAEAFLSPRYPLLLGRSQDVAYVDRHQATTLAAVTAEARAAGVLVPFPTPRIQSQIFSFPTYFNLDPARRALAVKPFHVLDAARGPQTVAVPDLFWRDEGADGSGGDAGLCVPLFDRKVLAP